MTARELRTLYAQDRLSTSDIARRYGVTRATVCLWLAKAGIPTRSVSERGKLAYARRAQSSVSL